MYKGEGDGRMGAWGWVGCIESRQYEDNWIVRRRIELDRAGKLSMHIESNEY